MNIVYKSQPNSSNKCGQTVLAMLLNKDIRDICKEMGRYWFTRNK